MARLAKGVYDKLMTSGLSAEIAALPTTIQAHILELGPEDAIDYAVRELSDRVRSLLRAKFRDEAQDPVETANTLLSLLSMPETLDSELLTAVFEKIGSPPPSPLVPLSQSALITNDQGVNYSAHLISELRSADRVDLICPFIGNQGVNLVIGELRSLGNRLRVITTTYLGATNQTALERLAACGAQVKIVYERSDQKTSLHAKAWIFHRDSGFTTATLGSSNLSPRALVDGLEWNVRLGTSDAPQVLSELNVTFERLWEDERFEPFDPGRDADKLKRALRSERSVEDRVQFFADLRPLPHQSDALQELSYARLEGRTRNLIVAATGTGKTLLAAFDYQRLCKESGRRQNLLFVAHRADILEQSQSAFQAVLRDSDFGELHVGSQRAHVWTNVFASIQSLHSRKLEDIDPEKFDIVVVDEFHHAEAPTYKRLLDHLRPRQLLGLTATPERADGINVIDFFGSPTYELRLWHALERGLLCPFHYFGVDDRTDLSDLTWAGGRYDVSDLEESYVERGDERAALVVRELKERAPDERGLRAVSFCASIKHANYMATRFREAGYLARALHSEVEASERKQSVNQFRRGELQILCVVDLFNEGIDIPEIDTVLFLRPTESATVFVQQLGRGLRNHSDKGALTVLDFVGRQNVRFRQDLRFMALTGLTRSQLATAVEEGFPALPPGCHIRLDRSTQERVLKNIKEAVPSNLRSLLDEIRRMATAGIPLTLASFLTETGLSPTEFYRGGRSFAQLMCRADMGPNEPTEMKRIEAIIHADDVRRLRAYSDVVAGRNMDDVFERMLSYPLLRSTKATDMPEMLRHELSQLFEVLEKQAHRRQVLAEDLPFALHSHYSRDEIVAPFRENPESMRQGTFYVERLALDIHLVTLRKSERSFSPTTRYDDYFTGPNLLHWESQSTTSLKSETGQRLVHGRGRHLFFVREDKDLDRRTSPFMCIGFAKPLASESEKPIRIIWQLEHLVPDHAYVRLKNAAG